VHNSFLGFWLNTGLVGLLLYLGAFLSKFIKAASYSILAFPIMLAMLFSANFEAWLMASLNPFTMQLFIILVFLNSPFFYEDKEGAPSSSVE
jgi:O-antigen ligase